MTEQLYFVTDSLPSHDGAIFIEMETADGRSVGSSTGIGWTPYPTDDDGKAPDYYRLGPIVPAALLSPRRLALAFHDMAVVRMGACAMVSRREHEVFHENQAATFLAALDAHRHDWIDTTEMAGPPTRICVSCGQVDR